MKTTTNINCEDIMKDAYIETLENKIKELNETKNKEEVKIMTMKISKKFKKIEIDNIKNEGHISSTINFLENYWSNIVEELDNCSFDNLTCETNDDKDFITTTIVLKCSKFLKS